MKTHTKVKLGLALVALSALVGALGSGSNRSLAQDATPSAANPMCSFPTLPFPAKLSPDMPYDVDMAKKHALEQQQKFAQVQRLFDIWSWQTFIALNWPADRDGNPDRTKKLGDPGRRIWETWMEAYQVYKPDGSGPQKTAPPYDWGTRTGLPPGAKEGERALRMAYKKNTPQNLARAKVADETLQAFTGPLVDQNGKWVRYEVLMNEVEYDYVVENQFYNVEGQLAFSNAHKTVAFPSGMNATGINPNGPVRKPQRGAMEAKLAWKELGPGDVNERFLQMYAWVLNTTTNQWSRKLMGLVGMHLAIKTESSPTWIWATFEQVDNVRANPLLAGLKNRDGVPYPAHPSFYDPGQPTKPVNVLPKTTGVTPCDPPWNEDKVTYPVQVTRVIPIPPDKEELNCEVQNLLRGTVYQYYELIATQWPTGTDPKTGTAPLTPAVPPGTSFPAPPDFAAPNSVANKSPGDVTPVFLTNTTMETYLQKANQAATPEIEGSSLDKTKVFATESCTGCHYSAGIAMRQWTDATGRQQAIYGGAGNGDYSWLMVMKAQWKNPPKSPCN